MPNAIVALHVKEMEIPPAQRRRLEARCQSLAEAFPELTHLEVSLRSEGAGLEANAHATGKGTDAATHATADEPLQAAGQVLDKLAHQLRREHDKRIFTRRRNARHRNPKREIPS